MNYYEAQDAFKKMYPDRLVTFEFDEKCIRRIECVYTDGEMHMGNHIEYRHVKVIPEGMPSLYVPIDPHREIITAATVKAKIPKDAVYVHPDELKMLKELKDSDSPYYTSKLYELASYAGIDSEQIAASILK